MRQVNPLAKLSDTDGCRGLGCLLAEVIPPVVAHHKMRRVVAHLAEHQRIGNVPNERPDGFLNGDSTIERLRRFAHNGMDLLQIAELDLCLEVRCPRKLTGQCLTQQVIHRTAEIGSDGRLRIETVAQRTELLVLFQLVSCIQRTGRDGIQSVGGIQMILDPLT